MVIKNQKCPHSLWKALIVQGFQIVIGKEAFIGTTLVEGDLPLLLSRFSCCWQSRQREERSSVTRSFFLKLLNFFAKLWKKVAEKFQIV